MPSVTRYWPADEILSLDQPDGARVQVRVLRSARRTKSLAVGWVGPTTLEVRAPLTTSVHDIEQALASLWPRLQRSQPGREAPDPDTELEQRAQQLNASYFRGKLSWRSIRYVRNQHHRYGSCTPNEGTIRISERVQNMPSWVRDYVLIHELAHLQEPNHSPAFWALVKRYRLTERARGFLQGVAYATHQPQEEGDDDADGA